MDERLSTAQIVLLIAYAIAMAGGQILFKLAALRNPASGALGERFLALAHNEFFAAAMVLYGGLAVLWVWILTFTPLSQAYIFVALAFAITPAAGTLFFAKPISGRLVVGIGLIILGLVCVAG
jgi:drug/metabolite transporter (DMT)-like permease